MAKYEDLPEIQSASALSASYRISSSDPSTNLKKILKDKNIKLVETDLPDDVSGILDTRVSGMPVIFINKNQSQVRQRFSIAHELGHLLLHASSGSQLEASIHLDKHTFYRNPLSSKGIDEQEKEANRFAAELLMPSVYLKEKIGSCPDMIDCDEDIVSTIAKELKVSTTALSLKLTGIIKGMGL